MMSDQIDRDFTDDDDARSRIAAAVRHLLRDATGGARAEIVREIIDTVQGAANGRLPADVRATRQPPMSGVTYKAYVIDAFRRDADNWRSTIRRLDGKKIRVAVPPSVVDQATTSADALTAEKAVELARKAIDAGGLI
jgi:hypothetical protein